MSLYNKIYSYAVSLKKDTEYLVYGRDIVQNWAADAIRGKSDARVLDIGCGQGNDLENIRKKSGVNCSLYGIEYFDENIKICESKGIATAPVNVERDRFPYQDEFFDVVVANQIIEHTKDTFYMVSEISRILKKGGIFIVGVPNLAAYHDRLILLLGQQPSGAKMLGPHVRGITRPALDGFIECDGYFVNKGFKGSAFFPFPVTPSKILARLFPSLATSIFCKYERTDKEGLFINVLKSRFFETNYYEGNE